MKLTVASVCPLCGGDRGHALVGKIFPGGQRLLGCEHCGLVRLFSETPFRPDYWEDDGAGVNVYEDSRLRAELRRRYARYLTVIDADRTGTGALLDAGCGIGNFLMAARDAGWCVAGVEVSAKAAAIARRVGLDVEISALEDSRQPPGAFDVVTLWDLIEHVEDPVGALRAVHDKLRPGGTVFLETPNEGFWGRSLLRRAFAASRGRVDLLSYFYYPDHRFYFTRATLVRLLETAGFKDVRVWHDATAPTKARLKIAAARFPCHQVVLPLLPVLLGVTHRLGAGNKLMAAATRA